MFLWGRLSGGLGLVIRWLSVVMSTSSHPVLAVERRCTTIRPPLSIPRPRRSHKRFRFLKRARLTPDRFGTLYLRGKIKIYARWARKTHEVRPPHAMTNPKFLLLRAQRRWFSAAP